MLGAHAVMAVAAGLTVGGFVAVATDMAPSRLVKSPVIKAFCSVWLPILLGGQTWSAADRNDWRIVAVYIVGSGVALTVSAWERRKRT
jgi:hypothetical protein